MTSWTFAAIGFAVGAITGWAAGRATERALWALQAATWWWRETRYWATRAAAPIATVTGLALLAIILAIWL